MKMDFENNILLSADDFYDAHIRCITGKEHKIIDGRDAFSVVNIPAIVNGAFACELYMKSMFKGEMRTHNLSYFYSKLSKEIKGEIEQLYQQKKIEKYSTFKDALFVVRNAFVEWRYLFQEENRHQCNPCTLNEF